MSGVVGFKAHVSGRGVCAHDELRPTAPRSVRRVDLLASDEYFPQICDYVAHGRGSRAEIGERFDEVQATDDARFLLIFEGPCDWNGERCDARACAVLDSDERCLYVSMSRRDRARECTLLQGGNEKHSRSGNFSSTPSVMRR